MPFLSRKTFIPAVGLILLLASACSPQVKVSEQTPDPGTPPSQPAVIANDDPEPGSQTADFAPLLDVSDLVRVVEPSVVRIDSRTQTNTLFGGGIGTGFVIDSDGLILTNNHVVELPDGSVAPEITVTLYDGSEYTARVVGRYVATDTALLVIDATGLAPLQFGDLDSTEVGDPVVAFGFALDLERGEGGGFTVTTGIISAKNREIQEEQATILGSIQTDAAINPGNSGGPLVNLRGQVVGMNTAIATNAGDVAPGIGFAVGVDTIRAVYNELRADGAVNRGLLGIQNFNTVRPAQARDLGIPEQGGIYIGAVDPSGPVAGAGVRDGDVIVGIGDYTIGNEADLIVALIEHDADDVVTIQYYRDGVLRSVDVALGTFPS